MTKFYIEKLIVTGTGKEPSILDFKPGLNIVSGPSDTGKSYVLECIDYLFGSDNTRLDRNTGYDWVKLIIATNTGRITLERQYRQSAEPRDGQDDTKHWCFRPSLLFLRI